MKISSRKKGVGGQGRPSPPPYAASTLVDVRESHNRRSIGMSPAVTADDRVAEGLQIAVRRGAIYLDRVRPGWDHRINVDTLDIANAWQCVLAQVYGMPFWQTPPGRYWPTAELARHGYSCAPADIASLNFAWMWLLTCRSST